MVQRIGIITFHCSYNYGSALQAYALKRFLELKGYDVRIINFIFDTDFNQYRLFRTQLYKKNIKALFSDLLFFYKNYKRKKEFMEFAKQNFNLTPNEYHDIVSMKELNKKFDIFICGSDQIWNLDCTQGIVPAYFLQFAEKNKLKIAYAPSLAHTRFSRDYSTELMESIKNIDYLSIREKSTLSLIQPLTKKHVYDVLDPTLLLDKADYEPICSNISNGKAYIFVYMLEYDEALVSYSNTISRNMNIPIMYIANKKFSGLQGKNLFGIGPNLFLGYIKNAAYIITNSFHATVFSIIFNKKFITFTTRHSSSRVVDLLHNLGISERIYQSTVDITLEIDYSSVKNRMQNLRKESISYLRHALKRE